MRWGVPILLAAVGCSFSGTAGPIDAIRPSDGATIDATGDGAAVPDAVVPDAIVPDAIVPDASPPDAAVDAVPVDASPPDAAPDAVPVDASPPDAPTDARDCGAGYATIVGTGTASKYKLYITPLATDAAIATCAAEGAHLMVYDSAQEEAAILVSLLPQSPSSFLHLGITDAATEGVWLTHFGTAVTYFNWGRVANVDEPSGGTNQNCAITHRSSGEFFDFGCGTQRSFYCECE